MSILWVVLGFLIAYGNCEEPDRCSQFYFVDKLLEKTIRMELKVESMEKEIKATNTDVLSALEELKQQREEFKMDSVKLNQQMQDLKHSMNQETVVFKARTVESLPAEAVDSVQTMIFNNVMFNYGDGYDNTTGLFTAPINGTYLFTFQLCVRSKASMFYGLVWNNIVHTSGRFYDHYGIACNTADGMMLLNVGDIVRVKCLHHCTPGILYEESSATYSYKYWNTFSGMLIHRKLRAEN